MRPSSSSHPREPALTPVPRPAPPADLVARLRAAGCVFAEEEAALLVAGATTPADLERLVVARTGGVPLELLLGYAEFCGLRVAVAAGVFVPRRRTALVVEQAAARLRPGAVVLDLCCGTGAIGAALAARVPGLEVWASDVDPDAVACARRNLPAARVLEGDLYDALPGHLRGRVDALVANAPYVPSAAIARMPPEAREHEHRAALDGGTDGLALQARVAAGAPDWLTWGGALLVETSDRQADGTLELLRRAGLETELVTDDAIGGTVAIGRRR
jgi:release factor glutamine methyltransferase